MNINFYDSVKIESFNKSAFCNFYFSSTQILEKYSCVSKDSKNSKQNDLNFRNDLNFESEQFKFSLTSTSEVSDLDAINFMH